MPRKPSQAIPDGAPRLEATLDSVKAFNTWLCAEAAAGRIPPVLARELTQMVRSAQAQIRIEAGLNEMSDLRRMLEEAKAAAAQALKNQVADRYSQSSSIGEFAA